MNSPQRSLLTEFATSASQMQGLILAITGIALSIIIWHSAPDTQIKLSIFWITIIVLLIIIWLLIDTCRRINGRDIQFLPRVIRSIQSNGLNNNPILILEESKLFGFGSLVTIYFINDYDIELQVGSGNVSTIQTDGKIQIEITQWAKAHHNVLGDVLNSSTDTLGRLLIKPTITSGTISGIGFRTLNAASDEEQQDETNG